MGGHQLNGWCSQIHRIFDNVTRRFDDVLDAFKLSPGEAFVQGFYHSCGAAHHSRPHVGPCRFDANTGGLSQFGKAAYTTVQLDKTIVELAEGDIAFFQCIVQVCLSTFSHKAKTLSYLVEAQTHGFLQGFPFLHLEFATAQGLYILFKPAGGSITGTTRRQKGIVQGQCGVHRSVQIPRQHCKALRCRYNTVKRGRKALNPAGEFLYRCLRFFRTVSHLLEHHGEAVHGIVSVDSRIQRSRDGVYALLDDLEGPATFDDIRQTAGAAAGLIQFFGHFTKSVSSSLRALADGFKLFVDITRTVGKSAGIYRSIKADRTIIRHATASFPFRPQLLRICV